MWELGLLPGSEVRIGPVLGQEPGLVPAVWELGPLPGSEERTGPVLGQELGLVAGPENGLGRVLRHVKKLLWML